MISGLRNRPTPPGPGPTEALSNSTLIKCVEDAVAVALITVTNVETTKSTTETMKTTMTTMARQHDHQQAKRAGAAGPGYLGWLIRIALPNGSRRPQSMPYGREPKICLSKLPS